MNPKSIERYFFQQIQSNHLNHAYIFSGMNLYEKNRIVHKIIQALGCSLFDETGQPCEECDWCQRANDHQLSDIMVIEPEGNTIKVDQIRELREWCNRSPVEATFKIGIIKQSEKMNSNAANALLTLLEEPKSRLYFILYVTEIDFLLPTLRSRAQHIHFVEEMESKIQNITNGREFSLAKRKVFDKLPSQTVLSLLNLSDDGLEEWFHLTEQLYQVLYEKNSIAFALLQTRFNDLLTQHLFDLALDYLLLLNHEVLIRMLKNEVSQIQFIEQLVLKCETSIDRLLIMNDVFLEARKYLQANVSAKLVAEKIILDLIQ